MLVKAKRDRLPITRSFWPPLFANVHLLPKVAAHNYCMKSQLLQLQIQSLLVAASGSQNALQAMRGSSARV